MNIIRVFHHYSLVPKVAKSSVGPTRIVGVAIDVLRATTSMVQAIESGCPTIFPVSEVSEAFGLRDELARAMKGPLLLCGERGGGRVSGFDLGNSPREFSAVKAPLIMSTTNGTKAIVASQSLDALLIGSFRNAGAVGQRLLSEVLGQAPWEIWMVCSGTGGAVSAEDSLLAGLLADRLCAAPFNAGLDDGAKLARDFWKCHSRDWHHVLAESVNGRRLIELGLVDDITFASQLDVSSVVPSMTRAQGRLVLT